MMRSKHDFFTSISRRGYVILLLANLHAKVVSDYLVFHEAPGTSNSSYVGIPVDRKLKKRTLEIATGRSKSITLTVLTNTPIKTYMLSPLLIE